LAAPRRLIVSRATFVLYPSKPLATACRRVGDLARSWSPAVDAKTVSRNSQFDGNATTAES
jgi:hypothetical protein